MDLEEGGKIILIIGPMFSGKSTKLMKHMNISKLQKKSAMVVKYDRDNRYSNENKLVTHDRYNYFFYSRIEFPAISANKISDVYDELLPYEVIGIDEGQFYDDVSFKSFFKFKNFTLKKISEFFLYFIFLGEKVKYFL